MKYSVFQCSALQLSLFQSRAVQLGSLKCSCVYFSPFSVVLCSAVVCDAVWLSAVQLCAVQSSVHNCIDGIYGTAVIQPL